mmetsp:Transcript_24058/g.55796  ORF Transcript_24058/g.55796 Transcript_24058/m.55796 type:complete len:276 (-) Transcript_24058:109-936(-)
MLGGYPRQQSQHQDSQMQLAPRGQDPFGMFDDMMMQPFGGPAGGLFGSMFGQMNRMMQEMDGMMSGRGGAMMGSNMSSGGRSSMMMSGFGGGGGGSFSCQTFSFSSHTGADGQVHTEQYSSSAVGDRSRNMHEVQQMYSNSRTGQDKMSLERQLEGRGRKTVKERTRDTGEERQTDMFKGMSENDAADFDQDWQRRAVPALPQHQGFQRMLGDHRSNDRRASGLNVQPRLAQALPPSDGYGRPERQVGNGYQPYQSRPAPVTVPPRQLHSQQTWR